MSKRGGAVKKGSRFLSTEEEERLRSNILRRNSEREEGSEMDATDALAQVIGENGENESVANRVRRLEGGQGAVGQAQGMAQVMEQMWRKSLGTSLT